MSRRLRVALVAGTLAAGGAERQLVYGARALSRAGVEVRVFALTRGELYERVLREEGLEPVWVGRRGSPIARLWTLGRELSKFRPDVIQSTHSFANLYAGILGRTLGIASVGVLRSSLAHCAAIRLCSLAVPIKVRFSRLQVFFCCDLLQRFCSCDCFRRLSPRYLVFFCSPAFLRPVSGLGSSSSLASISCVRII